MLVSWWGQWFGGRGPRDAKALQVLLTQICRQETALASHLADRARAVRFVPHRLSLEELAEREGQNAHVLAREIGRGTTLVAAEYSMPRLGTLTATKLIQDLAETEDLAALYWQAGQLTSDGTFRGKLEGLAAEEAHSSWTIRGILATMDGYVTDSSEATRRGLELPSPENAARLRARPGWTRVPMRRHPEMEVRTMITKPWLDKEEARGAIRGPKGWSIVLDKQWSAPTFPKGGLTVRKRTTGPARHWPSPSSTKQGRI